MPRQMPSIGLPSSACSRSTGMRPLFCSFLQASAKAPTPGRIIAELFFILFTSAVISLCAPIYLSEAESEKRLPTP